MSISRRLAVDKVLCALNDNGLFGEETAKNTITVYFGNNDYISLTYGMVKSTEVKCPKCNKSVTDENGCDATDVNGAMMHRQAEPQF